MKKKLIYDLPTRLFHWIFAVLFLTAFLIGKNVDDESSLFPYHMLIGMTVGFLVILRLIWGFTGTKHARFLNFELGPTKLITYFLGILKGEKMKWPGHNPASSWAAILFLVLAAGLCTSGYLMITGLKEELEDIHELFANAFIITALMHIAGIALHTFRHKELIGLSMVNGKKEGIEPDQVISSSKPAFGLAFVIFVLIFISLILKGYDTKTRTLFIFGKNFVLSESEGLEE